MTGISWTNETWNPIVGCSIVSKGCTNCYAMKMAARLEAIGVPHYAGTTVKTKAGAVWTGKMARAPEDTLLKPLRWQRPRMIFVNSMSDLFHEDVPDEWIDPIFAVMALTPQHTYQILTKRPERMRAYLTSGKFAPILDMGSLGNPDIDPAAMPGARVRIAQALQRMMPVSKWDKGNVAWPLPNVWLGVSAEDQVTADERIPLLLDMPAALRWLSAEPLLGDLDISAYLHDSTCVKGAVDPKLPCTCRPPYEVRLDWVVTGGENGDRPMHPDWARTLRDQCAQAAVPFFFKQWGTWRPPEPDEEYDTSMGRAQKVPAFIMSHDGTVHCYQNPNVQKPEVMRRVGKKAAGDLLDGVRHHNWPQVVRS